MGPLKIALEIAKRGHIATVMVPDNFAEFAEGYTLEQHRRYCQRASDTHPSCANGGAKLPDTLSFHRYDASEDVEAQAARFVDRPPIETLSAITSLSAGEYRRMAKNETLMAWIRQSGFQVRLQHESQSWTGAGPSARSMWRMRHVGAVAVAGRKEDACTQPWPWRARSDGGPSGNS